MATTNRERMDHAIREWSRKLNEYPGWREWQRDRVGHTLYFDDVFSAPPERIPKEFRLPGELDLQHSIVMQYFELLQVIQNLRDCEYYFRRYPFHGLPVTKYNHLVNCCEMYCSRFYEFRERMKKYLNTIKEFCADPTLEVGEIIKLYDRQFDREIRERHQIHHHRRFEDVAIDRILLLSLVASKPEDRGWKRELRIAYRKASVEWVKRVRRRALSMDEYMEAIARITLARCSFLAPDRSTSAD